MGIDPVMPIAQVRVKCSRDPEAINYEEVGFG